MSILKSTDKKANDGTWSSRKPRQTRHKIISSNHDGREELNDQVIDYDKLRWLCCQDEPSGDKDSSTPSVCDHSLFMQYYHQMFVNAKATPKTVVEQGDTHSLLAATNISTGCLSTLSNHEKKETPPAEVISHEIKDHMALLHKERKIADPEVIKKNRIKDLRRLLRKLPFERSSEDNKVIFKHLKAFPVLSSQTTTKELKEICSVVTLDVWKDDDYTVFGNTGFYIVLKGSVVAQTDPWIRLKAKNEVKPTRNTTFLLERDLPELGVGDCFGCLEGIEGEEVNSQILTVKTNTLPCEFLKVSSNDYKRISQQLKEKDLTEKCNLVQPCESYKLWPRQSLLKLAELIEWAFFPENTVLVTEGVLCPFIGFIKSGECHVLRQVEVNHKLRNGKEEKRLKQVVMGKLTTSQSFGEISVLEEDTITCSIVTATDVTLGIITPEKISELDETTRSLLLQTNKKTFGNLSKDEIYTEYIEQELQREWYQFKQGVVVDVINSSGIQPGCGKWSKSGSQ
ncbi:cyclic nucleotide-binding domain-containing protein 1-like [Antedon mediterranea]|uniref:cyclic nucleotide-binding domain-containing protein 1-like n=1 Tax=Antedon mediterranea TaxID=105859 RepID=UPI003AF5A21B